MALKTEATTTPTLPPLETSKTSFEAPQNWGTPAPDSTLTMPPVIAPARQDSGGVGGSTMPKQSPPTEVESSPSVFKIILISLALILLGVLLGVLAAKFFTPTVSPTINTANQELTPTVEITPTPTIDPMADWLTYTDTKNKFEFLYPPKLGITTTSDKQQVDTLNISIVSGNLDSIVKKNKFDIVTLMDVPTSDSRFIFKKTAREANASKMVGFLSLSKTKTLVLTQYLSDSVADDMVNSEFNQIISGFNFNLATPSAIPVATNSATPAS